nr:N-acetyl-1-D-myo-inositol-2-amino-2-deoxy-alpha-D-glucopyranoside deacetylase [Streptomyces sp. DSM 41633]
IQAHRVAHRAAELAADPGLRPELGPAHRITRIYWNRVPRSVADEAFAALPEALADSPFTQAGEGADLPGAVADAQVTTVVDGTAYAGAKAAAMRAHATQITVAEPLFVLSNERAQPLFAVEYYERVVPAPQAPTDPWETD